MAIAVKDFVPEKQKGGVFKKGSMEQFEEVLSKMNKWIEEARPKIIRFETIVLPNIHEDHEEGSQDTELWTGGESSSHWYQIIRVWFHA